MNSLKNGFLSSIGRTLGKIVIYILFGYLIINIINLKSIKDNVSNNINNSIKGVILNE